MKAAGIKYKKGGSKRRTVEYSDNSSARAGKVGGIPVNTKTVTKKRGDKTITKTKSVSNPLFGGSGRMSKSKTVTTGNGPNATPSANSGSNRSISKNRAERMQKRMARKTPASKAPNAIPQPKDYIGNPMKYFNDKAMYGKEKALKAMLGKETDILT